jgi:hypothetical protein
MKAGDLKWTERQVRMYYSFYPQDAEFGKLTPFVPHPTNVEDYFETGHNYNNNISVAGGNENMIFRLSYNNGDIKGVMPGTSLKRNNLGLSTSLDVTKKLTVGVNATFANNKATRPSQGYQGSATGQVQWFQRNIDMERLKKLSLLLTVL